MKLEGKAKAAYGRAGGPWWLVELAKEAQADAWEWELAREAGEAMYDDRDWALDDWDDRDWEWDAYVARMEDLEGRAA